MPKWFALCCHFWKKMKALEEMFSFIFIAYVSKQSSKRIAVGINKGIFKKYL